MVVNFLVILLSLRPARSLCPIRRMLIIAQLSLPVSDGNGAFILDLRLVS